MKTKTSKKSSKVILAILLTVVTAGSVAWFINHRSAARKPAASPTTNLSSDGVNYNPPTEQDKAETEQNKTNVSEKVDTPKPTPSSNVTPLITYAGQFEGSIEAAGYVPGVYEEGGTCTYTFTLGSSIVTKQSAGFKDVKTTACPPIKAARSEFAKAGTWKLVLSYKSSSASGSSAAYNLEVQ